VTISGSIPFFFMYVDDADLAWRTRLCGRRVRYCRQAPALIRWRRSVQASRNVSDYRILELFSGGIETELIDTRLPRW
jgi:hypothetical protein